MTSAIRSDAPDNTLHSTDDAAEALLNLWKTDADEPSVEEDEDDNGDETVDDDETDTDEDAAEPSDEEDDEESDDQDEDAEEDDEEADEPEDKNKKKKVLTDNEVTTVTVDGKEVEVSVKDLKRLYGQEKALTQKSMEAATLRKKAEETGARYVASSEKLLERAMERYKPFEKIDWLVAARELETDELQALRSEAQRAYEDIQFLQGDLDNFMTEVATTRKQEKIAEARQTLKNLQDPVKGIKGFNEQMYAEMRVFAINQGVPEDVVNEIVAEPIIRLMHKAMLYDKGQKAVTKTKSKKNKTIIKSKVNSESTRTVLKKGPGDKAAQQFKKTGSAEDAAALLLARWTNDSDD